jgi:Coenzyme PQQ synthesis protein D (PqqD)
MHFRTDPANISFERLQDEVIIIDLANGAYYSGSGPAADLWTLISNGVAVDDAVAVLSAAYRADQSVVRRDVDSCLQKLIDLAIISVESEQAERPSVLLPEGPRGAWTAPIFDEYTEMWDLLKADPIHDVGEAGWPFAQPKAR